MKVLNFIMGFFIITFGFFLWNNPAETLITYAVYLGIVNLALAAGYLTYCLVYKIRPIPYANILTSAGIGIVFLVLPILSVAVVIGIFVFLFLTVTIYYLILALRFKADKLYYLHVVLSALAVAYGLVMLFVPEFAGLTFARIIALFVILNGVSYIALAFGKIKARR